MKEEMEIALLDSIILAYWACSETKTKKRIKELVVKRHLRVSFTYYATQRLMEKGVTKWQNLHQLQHRSSLIK